MNIKKLLLTVAVAFVGSGLLVGGLIASEEPEEEMATEVTRYPQFLGSGGELAASRKHSRRALEKAGEPQDRKSNALYRTASSGRTARRAPARVRNAARRGASVRTPAKRMPVEESEEVVLSPLVSDDLKEMNDRLNKEGHNLKMANSFIVALQATDFALDSLLNSADSSDKKEWEVVETNFASMLKAWNTYQPTVRTALGFKEARDLKHRRYDRAEAMKKIAEIGQSLAQKVISGENASSEFQSFVDAWSKRQEDETFAREMGYALIKAEKAYASFAQAHPVAAEAEEE